MASAVFGSADLNEMSLEGLVLKSLAMTKTTPATEITTTFDMASKRLCAQKFPLAEPVRLKFIDRLLDLAPQLSIRPIEAVADVAKVPSVHLCVVVDTSGSMSSCIRDVQQSLKRWIDAQMIAGRYSGLSIIFFDSCVYGPFYDTACLTTVHGSGSTRAVPALEQLRSILSTVGPSHVAFLTDGEFDERKQAYEIAPLPNVVAFVIVFPAHTPESAEAEHFAYLPRVTPAGIPIAAQRATNADAMASLLDAALPCKSFTPIVTDVYAVIGYKYVMVRNMTIAQMNKLVTDLLNSPDVAAVHTFFSQLVGLFNIMLGRAGDLLNTLRSPEMRMMWGLLQPLKKRFSHVAEDSVHAATARAVLEFLEMAEAHVVDMRDKRLAGLKRERQTPQVLADIQEIHRAFADMKKVDDYERIQIETHRMKQKFRTIAVKFNYVAELAVDVFKGYPNLGRDDLQEIFKMIASIGVCNRDDPEAMELVCDPGCIGLNLVLRQMTYRKTDEVRMTLTVTQATRIAFGFVATQIMSGEQYECAPDHLPVREMLIALVTRRFSYSVMSNLTDMSEPVNNSPEWIRALCTVALKARIVVPSTHPPADKSLWIADEAGNFVLNLPVLEMMVMRGSAISLIRAINGMADRRNVYITHRFDVPVPDFRSLVVVKLLREQTWEEWRDEVVFVKKFADRSAIAVTNGMVLQERLSQQVNGFLQRNWERGHRLIEKTGAAHPASTYGANMYERDAFDAWIRAAWIECKNALGFTVDSTYPVAPSAEVATTVARFLAERTVAHPIFYLRDLCNTVPVAAIIRKARQSDAVKQIAFQLLKIPDFMKLPGDEQAAAAVGVVPAEGFEYTEEIHGLLEARAEALAEEIASRMSEHAKVVGVGQACSRRRTVEDWDNLAEALSVAEAPLAKFDPEDFTDPITGEVLEDPVSYGGHIYERASLEEWFQYCPERSSPLTRATHNADGSPLRVLAVPSVFARALADFKAVHLASKASV